MHSATERQESGEKMKDEGKENPHKRAHCLPTCSFSHSGPPPGSLSPLPWCLHILLIKGFVKGGQNRAGVQSSSVLTETWGNKRPLGGPSFCFSAVIRCDSLSILLQHL